MDLISIIIVNYNTSDEVLCCVDSIYRYTKDVEFEIIVVDNCSREGEKKKLIGNKKFQLISSNVNLGFGKANNLGVSHASGNFIFLLNPDTYLLNNALRIFYEQYLIQDKHLVFMGCHLLSQDGKTENVSGGKFPCMTKTINEILSICLKKPIKLETNDVDYVTGADLFFDRRRTETLGLFDPDFFMYFEETELQYRYNKLGLKSKLISGPRIVHLECVTTKSDKKITAKHWLLYFHGYITYINKTRKGFRRYAFRLLLLLYLPIILHNKYSFRDCIKIIKIFFL